MIVTFVDVFLGIGLGAGPTIDGWPFLGAAGNAGNSAAIMLSGDA
jgi:hypothetical protein